MNEEFDQLLVTIVVVATLVTAVYCVGLALAGVFY